MFPCHLTGLSLHKPGGEKDPGHSPLAAMYAAYLTLTTLPKMPTGEESGLQAPQNGSTLTEGRLEGQNLTMWISLGDPWLRRDVQVSVQLQEALLIDVPRVWRVC